MIGLINAFSGERLRIAVCRVHNSRSAHCVIPRQVREMVRRSEMVERSPVNSFVSKVTSYVHGIAPTEKRFHRKDLHTDTKGKYSIVIVAQKRTPDINLQKRLCCAPMLASRLSVVLSQIQYQTSDVLIVLTIQILLNSLALSQIDSHTAVETPGRTQRPT